MKHIELELKKKLLIVEADYQEDCIGAFIEDGQIYTKVYGDVKYWAAGFLENVDIEGKWKAICKGSELTEEIAKEIVDKKQVFVTPSIYNYVNYKAEFSSCLKAFDSFISAIEANGYYWGENPIYFDDEESDFDKRHEMRINWEKAKSKTFNPEKTIIFEIMLENNNPEINDGAWTEFDEDLKPYK